MGQAQPGGGGTGACAEGEERRQTGSEVEGLADATAQSGHPCKEARDPRWGASSGAGEAVPGLQEGGPRGCFGGSKQTRGC